MGNFDDLFRGQAEAIIELFATGTSTFQREFVSRDERERETTIKRELVTRASPLINYDRKLVDGRNVMAGDAYVFVSELHREAGDATNAENSKFGMFKPNVDTVVRPNGERFKVVGFTTYESGDEVAVYEIQLRRS